MCNRQLHADVGVTNLSTLVKHADGTDRQTNNKGKIELLSESASEQGDAEFRNNKILGMDARGLDIY